MEGWEGQMPEGLEGLDAASGMIGGAALVIYILLVYVYPALCLHFIASKTNTSPAWLAWIPIANVVLMLMVADKPIWWIVLLFIPLVNLVWIVLAILVWMGIAEKRGKSSAIGILIIVPFVNLIMMGYLAFSK